jgi:hypothetical protein
MAAAVAVVLVVLVLLAQMLRLVLAVREIILGHLGYQLLV